MRSAQRPAPSASVPAGYHHEAYVALNLDWRVPAVNDNGCRQLGPGRVRCNKPPVATLFRGSKLSKSPWNYCAEHLYGGWIENGQVMRWRVVKDTP